MNKSTFLSNCILFIFMIAFMACENDLSGQYPYTAPNSINDGLKTGTLDQAGFDKEKVIKASYKIHQGKYKEIHSLLIYKDEMFVFEEYFRGHKYKWDGPEYHGEEIQWHQDSLHTIMSCTKSFTSALIGIAINKGYIKGVNQSIFDYLPDHQHLKTKEKEKITIEHLLTMTSGLEWNEWNSAHGTSANDIDRIYIDCSDDPISCILERELIHTPGEYFTYTGGGMIILGEIIQNASEMQLDTFANNFLFTPLGIDSVRWYQFDNRTFATDGSLYMTPRDMLKFGILFLNNGVWEGKSILPASWIEKSKTTYKNNTGINIPIDDSGRNGYAYTWWTNKIQSSGKTLNLFQAGGWGGQEIIVFPEINTVIVFTGGNYTRTKRIHRLLKRYILRFK